MLLSFHSGYSAGHTSHDGTSGYGKTSPLFEDELMSVCLPLHPRAVRDTSLKSLSFICLFISLGNI